jgi:hypothetical protein
MVVHACCTLICSVKYVLIRHYLYFLCICLVERTENGCYIVRLFYMELKYTKITWVEIMII